MALKDTDIFPHTCKVYRITDEDEWTDGTEEVIYEGICRDEGNSTLRTYTGDDNVIKADHAVYIPTLLEGVTNECFIDVTNYSGEINKSQITSCQPVKYGSRVGTTIYFNEPHN